MGQAARIAVTTVREALPGTSLERATFVLFSADLLEAFRAAG